MVEKYNYSNRDRDKKIIVFVFVMFLLIAFSLVYFAFFGSNVTGVFIQEDSKAKVEDAKRIQTSLTFPDNLSLTKGASEIEIKTSSKKAIQVGGKKTSLSNLKEAHIVIKNYSGGLLFNGQEVIELDGRAKEVSINDVSISTAGGYTEVKLKRLSYGELMIEDVYLDEFSYKASGLVNVDEGKTKINLNDELFELSDFRGDLAMSERLELDGECKSLTAGDISIGG